MTERQGHRSSRLLSLLALGLGLSLGLGCTVPNPEHEGGLVGEADTALSGSEDEEGEEAGTDAPSDFPGATCELAELTEQPSCDACLAQSCCDLAQACADHSTCGCIFACLAAGDESPGCVLACGLELGELSPAQLEPLLGCATSHCLGDCALAES